MVTSFNGVLITDFVRETKRKIDKIDFSQVLLRLKHYEGFSNQESEDILNEYKSFLCYISCYSGKVSPSKKVDLAWHIHILNTKKYHNDCHVIAGRYLHHNPVRIEPESPFSKPVRHQNKQYANFVNQFYKLFYNVNNSFNDESALCLSKPTQIDCDGGEMDCDN